jgi:hypothetical protein
MKKSNFYKRSTCRLCHSKDLKLVLRLTKCPLPDAYISSSELHIPQPLFPHDLLLCKKCGNTQLSVVVDPTIVYTNYLYKTVTSLGLVKHFDDYSSSVISSASLPKKSLVIDIGSNDGSLLASFKKKGMRVLGIDPAVNIARQATESGIETLPEYFSPQVALSIKKKYGLAQVITANNTFANIDDLDTFMDGVKIILSPAGVFIMETFYLMSLMKHMVFDSIYHEHMEYFTTKPLIAFFQKHGMDLIDYQDIQTKGGSARFTVAWKNGYHKPSPSVKKQLIKEKLFGVHRLSSFKAFEKRINTSKTQLMKLLLDLKKKGKIIAGFGASSTCTILTHHFDLGNIIPYVFDENTLKQNRFTPHFHVPVLAPGEIDKRKPDYILILAWRYADPIVTKNSKYLKDGGKFIIPLPKLRIIDHS